MPPKPGIHPGGEDNFIHAMPAYIPDLQSAGVKWVSGFPENFKKGFPYINGLLILNDADTGIPISMMACVWITAKRTGAATAIIHADLGELATGQKPGRETPEERTMTANLGLALDDMAVAPLLYKQAVEKGIGKWLEL